MSSWGQDENAFIIQKAADLLLMKDDLFLPPATDVVIIDSWYQYSFESQLKPCPSLSRPIDIIYCVLTSPETRLFQKGGAC
jgi:hypothetical protein